MTEKEDAGNESSSEIQHTYFGFSDLPAENSTSPGKEGLAENVDRKDIEHTYTVPDAPELKERERDNGSSFTLYSTIDEARRTNPKFRRMTIVKRNAKQTKMISDTLCWNRIALYHPVYDNSQFLSVTENTFTTLTILSSMLFTHCKKNSTCYVARLVSFSVI